MTERWPGEPDVLEDSSESAVVEQLPIETPPNAENARYLATKRAKLGHRLHHQDVRFESDRDTG